MKRTSLLFLISLVFSFICLFLFESSKAQSPQEPTKLFDLIGTEKTRSTLSIAGVREQEIKINFDKIIFETAQSLSLPLLDGKSYEATRRESEGFVRFAADEFTWRGKTAGDKDWSGDIILTVKGNALSGLIYLPDAVYEIIPQENFKHILVELDQSRFPPCAGALPALTPENGSANVNSFSSSNKLNEVRDAGFMQRQREFDSLHRRQQSLLIDDGSLLDVLVVYTSQVRSSLGGTTQTQAFIQQAIASTNTAYQNSVINPRLRLVNSLEVNYTEAGTLSAALEWVDSDATVAAARNTSKADLVAILVENASDGCGLAYVMRSVGPGFANSGFSATARSCAVGNLSFAHELGHNQGSEHNPENGAASGSASYPYAFGHYVNGSFRTVMSYADPCPSGCNRVAYFSNPSVTFNGSATGITNQRDNHRVINNTALTVSQFRDSGGGGGCTYALNPMSRSFTATGGSGSFSVTTGSSCSWTATVNAPSLPEIFSRFQQENLLPPVNTPVLQSGLAKAPTAPQAVYLNSTPITINDRTSNTNPPGIGSLYPSTINVSGLSGTVTQVTASLNGLSHTFPDDVDVLLVGPGGQRVILMSDAGGNPDVSGVNLTFDQSAAPLPDETQIVSGTYRPTNFNTNTSLEPGGVDNFPASAPGQAVYGSDLNVFNGTAANGAWQLYVIDDEATDSGNIATGWALGITTSGGGTSWINITSGSSGTGNGTVNYTISANSGASQRTGTITVNGQVHTITQAGSGGSCPVTQISPGQTISGSLTTSDCIFTGTTRYVDVYNFNGTAGQRVAVSMNSSTFDTYLYLVNSSNQVLAEDDDGGGSTNSRIPASSGYFTLPTAGSYSIWASSFSPDSTGAYSISLVNEIACTFSISPTSQNFSSSGGSGSFNVSSASGCTWSAISNATWITTSSSGSGNGTVTYTVAANSGTSQSTGTITVGGQTYTITQSGATTPLRIDNVAPKAGRAAGGQTITLTGAFAGLSTVTIGGTAVSWSYTSGTSAIAFTSPAHAVGAVDIVLTPTSGSALTRTNAFAYLPTVFTDDTLVAGVTTAKAQHITELRQAVDALRAVAGQGTASWTDFLLLSFASPIKAVHIMELRTYLNSAAGILGYSTASYTDPSLTASFQIKRLHIEELRQRIRAIAG